MHFSVENWIKTILLKKKIFEALEEVSEGEKLQSKVFLSKSKLRQVFKKVKDLPI